MGFESGPRVGLGTLVSRKANGQSPKIDLYFIQTSYYYKMFELQPYCETKFKRHYYKLHSESWWVGNGENKLVENAYLDMDSVDGTIIVIANDKVVYKVRRLTDFYMLAFYFHVVQTANGVLKFIITNADYLRITVVLDMEMLKTPLYIYNHTPFTDISPKLELALAKNEEIHEDLNAYFKYNLYNYQENNVSWMMNFEELSSSDLVYINYPDLKKHRLRHIKLPEGQALHNRDSNVWYPYSHVDNLPWKKHTICGGLLCDEVGLGKTFSFLALIVNTLERGVQFWTKKPTKRMLNDERKDFETLADPTEKCKFRSTATLVFCPNRLVGQWKDEINKFMLDLHDLRVIVITSITNYRKLTPEEVCNADIIIVSYRFLNNHNYRKFVTEELDKDESPRYSLTDYNWKRIVLDEGHERDLSGSPWSQFDSTYKWISSATPFPNGKSSVNSYLSFLTNNKWQTSELDYATSDFIETFIAQTTRCNTHENVKNQIYIPPIKQSTVLLEQSALERTMYVNATGDPTRMIQICTNILVSDADAGILGETSTLEEVQQRMISHYDREIAYYTKQAAIHTKEYEVEEENLEAVIEQYPPGSEELKEERGKVRAKMRRIKALIKDDENTVKSMHTRKNMFMNFEKRIDDEDCVICYDKLVDPVLTKCSHIFCGGCMNQVIRETPNNVICPLCRTPLNKKVDIGYLKSDKEEEDTGGEYGDHVQKWGTKMAWLIQYLNHILAESVDHRVIIFSQWTKMLKLVGKVLTECDIPQIYLRGTAAQLANGIRKFKTSENTRVLMLSSETCSSGSNLTEASHIILLDTVNGTSHKAQAIENQAIGRAARLGQDKEVQVIRLIMKNTIEHEYYKENIDQDQITELDGGKDVVTI